MVEFLPNEGFFTQVIVIYKKITKVSEYVKVKIALVQVLVSN